MDPLIVDVYEGDLNGRPDWSKLAAAGYPWCGAILKATEGLHYSPDWFKHQWSALSQTDLVQGCYHYLRFNQDGKAQADYFLKAVAEAGGFCIDTPSLVVVDVERGNNAGATKAQVKDCTSAFSARLLEVENMETILYGGELLASLGIADHMGCSKLWLARYTATLPAFTYERIGWKLEDLFASQYCGDGEAYIQGYPHVSPIGKTDISAVLVNGGGQGAMEWLNG